MVDRKNPLTDRLFDAILSLENREECYRFFEDLCTIKELRDMSQRLAAAELLSQGKSHNDITGSIPISPGTVGRVNRALLYGTGGYEDVIGRLPEIEIPNSENT